MGAECRDEEGAIEDMRGVSGKIFCHCLTILENIVTVGELAEVEENVGWPHLHPGDLQEGVGRGCEKSHCGGLGQSLSVSVQVGVGVC